MKKKIWIIICAVVIVIAVYIVFTFFAHKPVFEKSPLISMKKPKIEGSMRCTINGNSDDIADVNFKEHHLEIIKYSLDRSGKFETETVQYELIGDKNAKGEKMYQKLIIKNGKFLKGIYNFLSLDTREGFPNSYWYFHLKGDKELKCQIDETKVH